MRAFIVGNGPSLAHTPLEDLQNEVTFACNRIHLLYESTDWRPTHYVRTEGHELFQGPDKELWREELEYHIWNPEITVWANPYFTAPIIGKNHPPDVNTIHTCAHYNRRYHDEDCPVMWHLPVLCSYGSSVNVAMQIAVKLGYGPLYLVGCDLGYKDDTPNHFAPEYEEGYRDMLRQARYANLDTLNAHMIAARSCPVEIYNATLGGELEVYPRVDIEEVLSR